MPLFWCAASPQVESENESENVSRSVVSNSFVNPWTTACQASVSIEFSRQEYWVEWPCLSPRNLPDPGVEPRSPTLQADSLLSEPAGKPLTQVTYTDSLNAWHWIAGSLWQSFHKSGWQSWEWQDTSIWDAKKIFHSKTSNHLFLFWVLKCPVLKKNNGDVCNNILMFNLQIGFLHLCAFLNSQYINLTHKNMHFYQVY